MDALIVHIEGIGCVVAAARRTGRRWRALLRAAARCRPTATATRRRACCRRTSAGARRKRCCSRCEVAAQACAMAARDAAALPCVFASTHGDLAITDYMCATLAGAPRELSPTKFHNSVHNAPAGYWTIATHCHAASNAVCAWRAQLRRGTARRRRRGAGRSHAGAVRRLRHRRAAVRLPRSCTAPSLVRRRAGAGPRTQSAHAGHAAVAPPEVRDAGRAGRLPYLLANTLPLLAALAHAQPAQLRLPDSATGTLAIECAPHERDLNPHRIAVV